MMSNLQRRIAEAQQQSLHHTNQLIRIAQMIEAKEDAGQLPEWENNAIVQALMESTERRIALDQSGASAFKDILNLIG